MSGMTLYIGNKNLSSWSFRAWLALKAAGIQFQEVLIPLYQDNSKTNLLKISPSGFVPCLHHGHLKIHDSLAISEYIHELHPEAHLYPVNPKARAVMRSISAEMHSGFTNLRKNFPMNMRLKETRIPKAEVQKEINRIFEIWRQCKTMHGTKGPYLFSSWSLADIFFAPVVSRFLSYGITPAEFKDYMQAVSEHPHYQEWYKAGIKEELATC